MFDGYGPKFTEDIIKDIENIETVETENSNNKIDLIFSLPNIEDILKKLSLIYGENPLKIEHNGMGRNNLLFMSLILSYIL